MVEVKSFFEMAMYQDSPLRSVYNLLEQETRLENAKDYSKMRFVGYVLDIGFDEIRLITSDPFKKAVGGVPRGSFLVMVPDELDSMPPHFSLVRVSDTAPTPLTNEVQQTYFELHKKSMPELDVWTKSELQWGALRAKTLGMFFPDKDDPNLIRYSGDVNNIVSAHRYKVYAPTDDLLDLIVNGTVQEEGKFAIGKLRLTECQLPFANIPQIDTNVYVSTQDFRGFRTAMFGKTRLGKSNVVKIIAQSILETTVEDCSVGQLIFDINGEYANDNPQDGNKSLRSAYPDRCAVYAITQRESTPSRPLKLNFFAQPDACMTVLRSMLEAAGRNSQYIQSFASVQLPSIPDIISEGPGSQKTRAVRKIQFYWAILKKAGFAANETELRNVGLTSGSKHGPSHFDPHFSKALITAIYGENEYSSPRTLDSLVAHLERVVEFKNSNTDHKTLRSTSGSLFDADDEALLNFFKPNIGNGPVMLRPFMQYHSHEAGNFIDEILTFLDEGKTVLLDLGNATDEIRSYFSDMLSYAVFNHQEQKFTSNNLGNHFVQIYFEEAHNLFPRDNSGVTGIYARFAKEGAKFHIGMVYSTQSPSTISKELLAQTENFFVAHISSQEEVNTLAKLQVQYEGLQQDILKTRTPGYMRMMTFSNRFVIPVQINKFEL